MKSPIDKDLEDEFDDDEEDDILNKKAKKDTDEFGDELIDGNNEGDFLDDFGDDYGYRHNPMDKHPDLLKGLTDFSPHIRKLYINWLGLTWDEDKGKYIKNPNLEPVMNDKGASWNVTFIETYVRGNNILAHLNSEEYISFNLDINRTLMLTYAKRYRDFGFRCYSDVIRVWNEVENASMLALSGTGGGKYSSFLGGDQGGVISARYGQNPMVNNPNYARDAYGYPRTQNGHPGMIGKFRKWLMGEKQ